MSWEDAINAAKQDESYDLSKLTPEAAAELFKTKIDQNKVDALIVAIHQATTQNVANAQKLANVMAIIQTFVTVGKILA